MTLSPRPGSSATAPRSALVVLLLALAGLLGVTTLGVTTASAAPAAAVVQHHVDVPDHDASEGTARDRVVPAADDCPAHGSRHGAEALGLLSLRAPLGAGTEPAVCPPSYRVTAPAPITAGNRAARAHTLAHALGHDPLLWGISRT
ncbi:hypothetical protein [Promicromonospora sp. MEB111]|uniref:hypothetical protein n=1 Tax=Promicromonospora sp. MEB111 TaxID=3040301 RepID=UPI002550FC30|nr:hypothetical protein [Promicromonospora sp. MEB111]